METVGERVKALRKIKNISGRELSRMAGVSSGTISQLETGYIKEPSCKLLSKLAKALNTTIDYLYIGDDREKERSGKTITQLVKDMEIHVTQLKLACNKSRKLRQTQNDET